MYLGTSDYKKKTKKKEKSTSSLHDAQKKKNPNNQKEKLLWHRLIKFLGSMFKFVEKKKIKTTCSGGLGLSFEATKRM
jgi:hypothetical protein